MTWDITQEIQDYICQQLALGRSMISICKESDMPCWDTINKYAKKYPAFSDSIARAREAQADYFLDKQIEFTEMATAEDYQLRRFQADNLKWVASKLAPKKYGEKQNVEVNHKGTVGILTADLPGLCGLLAELASSRADTAISGDVPDRPLLSAPVRTE